MKKASSWIGLLLVFSLALGISAPAFASNVDLSTTEAQQAFLDNGHGEYILLSALSSSRNLSEVVYAEVKDSGDIYQLSDSKYLSRAYDNVYLLSDKIEVDTEDFANNAVVFDQYNISDNLRTEMQSVISAQKELGNEDLVVNVYAPSINEIQPLADEPLGTTYYTYTMDGVTYDMKDYSVKYSNLSSGMIKKKDENALPAAKSFFNFVVTCAGTVSKRITAFGVGLSAYDFYKSVVGEVVTGQSGDLIYTNLIWDKVIKETYCADPVYGDYPNPGCISYKVWLNRHDTYQFYSETGKGELTQPFLSEVKYSPNFEDPCPEAILSGISTTYNDPWIYTTLYGNKIQLT